MRIPSTLLRAVGMTGVAASCVLLTGCMAVTGTMQVHGDASTSGEFTVTVPEGVANYLGAKDPEGLLTAITSISGFDWSQIPVNPENCSSKAVETDYVLDCSFTDASLPNEDEIMSVVQGENDTVVFTFDSPGDPAMAENAETPGFSGGTLDLTVTFPGEVVTVEGANAQKRSANSVEVTGSLIQPIQAKVVSKSDGAVSTTVVGIAVVGGVALAGVAGAAVLAARSRKRGNDASDAEASGDPAETASGASPEQ